MPKFTDIFPLVKNTKRPACKWAEPWQGPPPAEPYGLPTGPRNGIWVLDIDRKNGVDGLVSLQEYAAVEGNELPDTYTVSTPSGGYHLYFLWDALQPIGNHVAILPGVDTRGAGGYVCAGSPYTILDPSEIAEAPEWLMRLAGAGGPGAEKVPGMVTGHPPAIGKSAGGPQIPVTPIDPSDPRWPSRIKSAEDYLSTHPPCVSGQGGQARLWEVCLRLSRTYELPYTTSWELFQAYNVRCVPPWEAWEVMRSLERAAELGHGIPGTFDPSALAPAVTTVRAAPVEEWRRRPNPDHVYGFDVGVSVAGGNMKTIPGGAKEIGAVFAGPAAAVDWVGVWQYDTFRGRIVAVCPPMPLDAETKGLTRADTWKIQVWLACSGLKATAEQIIAAITVAAHCAQFHPVRDYLAGLPSVDVDTARAYFQGIAGRLWGADFERDAVESGALQRMAIAAVRRIRRPGTKVDECLILTGPQGFNKSRFCAELFDPYFRDQMPDLDSRDASHALEGYWGIEMAELTAMSRTSVSTVKEFLTRTSDRYRQFGNGEKLEMPRQCVFIATTNEDDFFRDPTGESRYNVCEIRQPIDLGALRRDAWWSAACALETAGETHYRDRALASEVAESRHVWEDPWTGAVTKYVASQAAKGDVVVTASNALTYGLPVSVDKQRPEELRRVQSILRRKLGPSSVKMLEGRPQRVYHIPSSLSAHHSNAEASSAPVIFFPTTAGASG